MSIRALRLLSLVAAVLVAVTVASSRSLDTDAQMPSLPAQQTPTPKPDNNLPSSVGFRAIQGQLYAVKASGEQQAYPVRGLAESRTVVEVFDWSWQGNRPIVLIGVSEGHESNTTALVVLQGYGGRQIASDVTRATLSDDARFLTYATAGHVVVVADIAGHKSAEFRDSSESYWYRDKVIVTHAVDGIGADSSSETELLISSPEGHEVSVLVPSTFNAHHPTISSALNTLIFVSTKTGVSSFFSLDFSTRQISQLTNVGHTSFGEDSVPVPARPGRWSPDGLQYAFDVRHGDEAETWVLSAGRESASAKLVGDGREPLWLENGRLGVLTGGPAGEQRAVNSAQ